MFNLPTLAKLIEGGSFAGQLLGRLPAELILKADQQDFPWRYLLEDSAPKDLPKEWRRFLEAGHSQQLACIHLTEILSGTGTRSSCWWRKLGEARRPDGWDTEAAAKATGHIVDEALQTKSGRQWLLNEAPEFIRAASRERHEELYQKSVRRDGRKKADAVWKGTSPTPEPSIVDPLDEELVSGWLRRAPESPVGYCFFLELVLEKVLRQVIDRPDLTDKQVNKARENLGLKKAPIYVYEAKLVNGEWRFFDRDRNLIC